MGATLPINMHHKVLKLIAAGSTHRDIAKKLGVSISYVSKVRNSADSASDKPEMKRSDEVSGDKWSISLPKTRIHTLDELVRQCGIDLNVWEVERFVCNKWEVGAADKRDGVLRGIVVEPLFQVKAFLKKKKHTSVILADIESLKKEALKYSPKFTAFKPRKSSGTGIAAELFNTDHHVGGLIWGKETGGDSWDSKLAMESWRDGFCTLMNRVDGYRPEMAVVPLGSDQQNADNKNGTTTNLTPQSMDSRFQKVYELSKAASRFAIDTALQKYGRVHVPIVPGNHDRLTSWHLGDYLATYYANCPAVTIDNTPLLRKWWEWGIVMLMWEHGDKGKFPDYGKIMASEMPEMWGRTKWREAHTGHLHTRRVFEDKGYTARICPSLRPSCAWSAENHHTGSIRASEAFVWSKLEGLIGQATYSILPKLRVA
ncbi:helix-turn-helix domain-containing protein [Edaphobacter albus]|uniref:helix-turn-helix domain-containing protein n=1 Tax=Edaphobacter sp. 4G125 TaxID=2763071 RepID=UPI00164558E0|nr:helix-turn-helix domain-containing protein [Edaphobacter sp. 4G125]QNI37538.1 hypothetical protein H7846_04335 [Edaphobacter sp. 4G125]